MKWALGIVHLLSLSLYSILSSTPQHKNIVVLDSDSLSINPQSTLESLCQDLHIPYTESMLTWSSGKHHCDGPWADWWYADVHKSTGWIRNHDANSHLTNRKYRTLHPSLLGVLRSSMPAYEFLKSLSKRYQMRGPKAEDIYEDPRNEHVHEHVLVYYIGAPGYGSGRLVPRQMAGVSPWDSSVQGGDTTWEGRQSIHSVY